MDYKPMMCLTEYDEEATMRAFRREGFADGYTEGKTDGLAEGKNVGKQEKAVEAAITLIKKYNASPEDAAVDMGVSLDKVLEALN